jgi:hypothetical protein
VVAKLRTAQSGLLISTAVAKSFIRKLVFRTNQTGTDIKHFQQSLFEDVIERIILSPDYRNCRQQNQLHPQ